MNSSSKEFEIIPFNESHAENAAHCEAVTLGEEAWSEKSILETVALNGTYFVALKDGEYLGHGGFTRVLDEYYVTNIAVLPKFQRQGVASAILDKMLLVCRENGAAFLTLEVRESNLAARKLYEKYGFSSKGRRRGFYSDPKEDAIIMTLEFQKV